MVWERRYFGANEGWEHKTTKDLIFVMHRNNWEVILNGKTLTTKPTEKEANTVMEEYILKEG